MTDDSDLAETSEVSDDPGVTDDNKPSGPSLAEALLYAPLGLALELPEQLPKWVERGRNQVGVARMLGTFTLQNAPAGADKLTGGLRKGLGLAVEDGIALAPPEPAPTDEQSAGDVRVDDPAHETEPPDPAPDVETLAIPEYESLAASHVIGRLEGLSGTELGDIAAFERANRHRRTVLNRIEALLEEND